MTLLQVVSGHRWPRFVQTRLTAIALLMQVAASVQRWGACDRLRGKDEAMINNGVDFGHVVVPALLIHQYADRVAVDTVNLRQRVSLHFEH